MYSSPLRYRHRRNHPGKSVPSQQGSGPAGLSYLMLECSGFLNPFDALFAVFQALASVSMPRLRNMVPVPIQSAEGRAGSR